ncbi:hypothetical protein FRC17_002882, partial [Serendipita sp. 399]
MAKTLKEKIIRALRSWLKFATSKQIIPVLKGKPNAHNNSRVIHAAYYMSSHDILMHVGTIAYLLALALIFTRKYVNLSKYPPALIAMIIVTIAGGPGKTVGACIQGAAMAMGGVLFGSAFFAILAKLGAYPVAQAVVFAFMVYLMSILKTFGLRWFAFSLLAILMAFNGIYTSSLLNSAFSPTYLLEYLKAYAWGAAIVLAVNILIFPRTSERELRQTMVSSLEHIATFAALIGKAYTLTGTEEDKDARDLLNYQRMTDRIRQLQRTLLTAHISLLRFDEQDVEVFRDDILPPTKISFARLRRDIDLTIREVGAAMG